jgi:membrane protease YdiL (CAAX protease family)
MKRHPLIVFFVLAYALSWLAWIPYALGVFPNPVASFGPFLAALLVLALTEGRAGVLGLLRRMVRWRIAPGWYAVALLLPAGLTALATLLNLALGAEQPTSADLGRWTGIFGTFLIVLLVPGTGGAWEEPGWRGYALPRMQSRWSVLTSALVLGVLIAGWHLPLIVVGQVQYPDLVLILAAAVVFNWLFNHARGSVLLVMLAHAANNAVSGSYFSPMFSGADAVRESWLLALVWGVGALAVIVAGVEPDLYRTQAPDVAAEGEIVAPPSPAAATVAAEPKD